MLCALVVVGGASVVAVGRRVLAVPVLHAPALQLS